MKTFEELQEGIKTERISLIKDTMEGLEKSNLDVYTRGAMNRAIEEYKRDIDNIEEIAIIDIGAAANTFIRGMQTVYQAHSNDYFQNFEKFIDDYVIGGDLLTEARLTLGVDRDELLCFKGRNPMSNETGDLFRKIVNANFGTNIPMSNDEQEALQAYENVDRNDKFAAAEAFVRFKEIERDSGALKVGGHYYPLVSDEKYQEAKDICQKKSL